MSAADDDRLVDVTLLALPVRLQQETSEHHDALIREFSLIKASASAGSIPHRLLTVIEQIEERYRGVGEPQRAALQDAADKGLSTIDITYSVPASAGAALAEAGALLREADDFCRAGQHLVTHATPPVIVAYREWFIDEFVRQIAGQPPRPWTPPEDVFAASPSWPTRLRGGEATVVIGGELDLATAPGLRDHFNALHLSGVRTFALDTSGVTFVDSVGLSVMLSLYRRCREEDGSVRIVSPSPTMQRTLEVAGLADVLEIAG